MLTRAHGRLLGFAIERIDPAKDERYYLHGFKVFPSIVPEPDQATYVSTYVHPIQSLVWDDFTAEPGHDYTYVFHPLAGTPKKLDRSRASVSIDITTERLKGETHDVFFNRGVASSQAYARTFLNLSPTDQPSQSKRRRALQWLSRDLDEAMLAFVRDARNGDAIRGCFYEFSYGPVLAELAEAISRGVDVKLVVDSKVNEHTVNEKQPDGTTKPVFYESSPRLTNLAAIAEAALPPTAIIPREARRSAIAHNKFMVLLTGNPLAPEQVWTGSTNLTEGGIHGQANVGHWIRDATTAAKFHAYWELLATDPGGRQGDTQSVVGHETVSSTSVDVMSHTRAEAIAPGSRPCSATKGPSAAVVRDAARRGRRPGLHHLRVHRPRPLQGCTETEPQRRTLVLPAVGEGGPARPELHQAVHPAERGEQRLHGLRSRAADHPWQVGRRD
jgi:hypothetical protein